jgi:hypothetical protein
MKPERKVLLAAALLAAAACAFGMRPAIGLDAGFEHTIYKQPAPRS